MSSQYVRNRKATDMASFLKKIFSEQFETDVEIVSASGSRHPCHKIFLTGNSPVFQAMFKGDSFKEGRTKSLTLGDMSKEGVEALLNYLYCIDSKKDVEAEYDCETCFELLEASEKYSMSKLQKSMIRIFLKMPPEWFKVDTTVELFCFSRNVVNCEKLMKECAKVLKSKCTGEVMSSKNYKMLFKMNPEAAMDLFNHLLCSRSTEAHSNDCCCTIEDHAHLEHCRRIGCLFVTNIVLIFIVLALAFFLW